MIGFLTIGEEKQIGIFMLTHNHFASYFNTVQDPRVERSKLHQLHDILAITICAVIAGADGWEDIAAFGVAKEQWFRRFLALPNGIPSHDTFGRLFARLNPREFQDGFRRWIQAVAQQTRGQVVPIDGKTLRHSYDPSDPYSAIHMVSAWASANRLVFAQVKTNQKSNEITAIPELLEILTLEECIVTIDALGCQTAIVSAICEKKADYIIALKANQKKLFADVQGLFAAILSQDTLASDVSYWKDTLSDHGRDVVHQVWATPRLEALDSRDLWQKLTSVALIVSERLDTAQPHVEYRYYIASTPADAQLIGQAVRTHWGIENSVHWLLDVAFREDASTIHTGHAPENMATLRHLALNLLQHEISYKRSIRGKRLRAGWDDLYLEKVVALLASVPIPSLSNKI